MDDRLAMGMSNNEKEYHSESDVDMLGLLLNLLENAKYIAVAACIGLVLSVVYTFFFTTPMYEATSKLYVIYQGDSAINLSDLQIGAYLANDYQEVFKTWEVDQQVIKNLGLHYSNSQLQNMLSVSKTNDSRVLYIKVTSPYPKEAATIANEFASVASKYISETMDIEEPNILSNAIEPKNPVSPNKKCNIILGFFLGGILGAGIFAVRFVLDDRIKTADDMMKYLNIPTLAIIPMQNSTKKVKKSYNSQRR